MPYPELPGYEILSVLGESDTSTVYHARFVSLDRPVALKILNPRLLADPEFVTRFREEIAAAAAMEHPNIVRVFACGGEGQLGFVTSELVEGESLRSLLQRVPMTPRQACRIVNQVAAALDYAHGQGVLHRNVSPTNVLIRGDFHVVMTDFGLARAMRLATLTVPGSRPDRARYMAPEQCATGEVDTRSDVYGLGVLLFEMLTGRTPFQGRTAMELYHCHQHVAPPRLAEFSPDLGRPLQRVLDRALEKDRSRRYRQPGELARDFVEAVERFERPLADQRRRQATPADGTPAIRVLPPEASRSGAALLELPAGSLTEEAPDREASRMPELPPLRPALPRQGLRRAAGAVLLVASVAALAALHTRGSAPGFSGQAILVAEHPAGSAPAPTPPPAKQTTPSRPATARLASARVEPAAAKQRGPVSPAAAKTAPPPAAITPPPPAAKTPPAAIAQYPPARGAKTAPAASPATSAATASEARPAQPPLEARFQAYLRRFQQYDAQRTRLSAAERSARLRALNGQLRALLAESEPGRLRPAMVRELGTLDWYRADGPSARSHWRQALALDPKDRLAAAWLAHTRDAELNQ